VKKHKSFDCVEMKNEIQARLLKQWEGLSDREIEAQITQDLKTSQSPIAQLWRRISKAKKEEPSAIAVH